MPVAAPDTRTLAEAGTLLRAGRLVAFPTETVYGLGADATQGAAVARIFAAKARPRFNPLIVHVPDLATAEMLAHMSDEARRLAGACWPGPLTLVLTRRPATPISELATAGLPTIAIRVPDHPIARALLAATGRPLAAPSANRSGHVSPTTAAHVAADLGEAVDLILDGGPTAQGIESTIIDMSAGEPVLLRPGALPSDTIEALLGRRLARRLDATDRPTAPGQLARHYATRTPLRLGANNVRLGEASLAFGPDAPSTTGPAINLSPSGDLIEAAAYLFAALRRLDAAGAEAIAVMPIPEAGLGEAINDRLRRAAVPSTV